MTRTLDRSARRAEAHAQKPAPDPFPPCPHVRALWLDGYTVQQIAGMVRRSVSDIRIMTACLPHQRRAGFDSGNLRRQA